MALLDVDNLNGQVFIGSRQGEILVTGNDTIVHFPHGCPSAVNPLDDVNFTDAEAVLFIQDNASLIRRAKPQLTVVQAGAIGYLRFLCARKGLISPQFVPQNHHVLYNDAVQRTAAESAADLGLVDRIGGNVPAIPVGLTQDHMRFLRANFTDLVCMTAFGFRQRGHHWQEKYDEMYNRLWANMQNENVPMLISWVDVVRSSFHGIFPSVLDEYWRRACADETCNGALIVRYDVACAGTAGPRVVLRGYQDLKLVAPGIKILLPDEVAYLVRVNAELDADRWAGSVNRKYYDAPAVRFDEGRVAAIAATIRAALEALANDAPLLDSPALKRIARNAPITGAVFARAVQQISTRSEVVDSLLIVAGE